MYDAEPLPLHEDERELPFSRTEPGKYTGDPIQSIAEDVAAMRQLLEDFSSMLERVPFLSKYAKKKDGS